MDVPRVRREAQALFDTVRALSFDGVGITRASYGPGETAAGEALRGFAEAEGLAVETDRAGNYVFRDPADDPATPAIWVGSHIDSVPQGGNYDGLAGVVAGLLCQLERRRLAARAGAPVVTVAFRGEESAWFGKAYMGSGALWGKLGAADLALRHRDTGQTLADCMRATGADVAAIGAGECLLDATRLRAFVELHIEQGPVMVARELPVAVVSGIRGNVRHNRIECHGDAQHSGVVMRLDAHWKELLERGTDLVVTVGIVQTDPAEHSISRIPGRATFSFEARSRSRETLESFYALARAEMDRVAAERGVRFVFDRRLLSEPATMDPAVCAALEGACESLGIPHDTLASGAGHDASLFANAGVPSGMLFVRNQHGSHNPREAMDLDDFVLGVQVLSRALERM